MIKTYLVTGAAGFIGSCVAKAILDRGDKVVTIDNLSTGYLENIPLGVEFIQGNCYDHSVIQKLSNYSFEAIYHIAGQSSGEVSFEDPEYDLNTNTLSTLLLLKFAKEAGVKRFIYASTMSVYGDQEVQPVSEKNIPSPKSFYAVGKLASERYLKIYSELGLETYALRLFNVYGPGQNLSNMKQGMLSIFLAQALKQKHVEVKGSLNRYRDFVYIDDVVNAFLLCEQDLFTGFQPYNICSGTKTTVGKLVELIRNQMNDKILLTELSGTPGDQYGIVGNAALANSNMGWEAQVPMNEGITKMIDWAKQLQL